MNLKRLLTVGGSLEARRGASGRYRMAPSWVLPRFELRGDTLTAVPIEGVVPSGRPPVKNSTGPLFDSAKPLEAPAAKQDVTAVVREPGAVPNPFAAEAAGRPLPSGFFRGMIGAAGSVLSDAFSGRRKRARKRAERETVQGELGLESIRPLRNDLSGSDFEVVAAPVLKPGLRVRGGAFFPAPISSPKQTPRADGQLLGTED